MVTRMIHACLDHPGRVLFCFVVITGCWLMALRRLNLETDGRALFDPNHPDLLAQGEIDRTYGGSDFTVAGLSQEDGGSIFTPEALNWLLHFTRKVQTLDGVRADEVRSLATTPTVSESGASLRIAPPINGEVLSKGQADHIRSSVEDDTAFRGTLVSLDGRAAAVYVPMEPGYKRELVLHQIEKLADDELNSQTAQSGRLRTYVLGPAAAESL